MYVHTGSSGHFDVLPRSRPAVVADNTRVADDESGAYVLGRPVGRHLNAGRTGLAAAPASLCLLALFALVGTQPITPDSHPTTPLPPGPATGGPAHSGAPANGGPGESSSPSATGSTPKELGPTSSAEELAIDASTPLCPGGCLTEAGSAVVASVEPYLGQFRGVELPGSMEFVAVWPYDMIVACQCVYPIYLRKTRRDPSYNADDRMASIVTMPMPVYRTICSTLYGDVESLPPCWKNEEDW